MAKNEDKLITTVVLTAGDIEKVDRLAEAEDRSRSNMLRKLIRDASEPARRAVIPKAPKP